jgi:predicted nucleic acid-binding protein
VAASADCIITGDDDLLILDRFAGIAILSPRAFVDAMDRG